MLAGAHVAQLPGGQLSAAVHGAAVVSSVLLWAFGTCLVPLLLAAGVWRHLLHRVPLRYEPGLWSMVFPVGMYGVASRDLGTAVKLPWLESFGHAEAWVALGLWLAVLLAMAGAVMRGLARLRRRRVRLSTASPPPVPAKLLCVHIVDMRLARGPVPPPDPRAAQVLPRSSPHARC